MTAIATIAFRGGGVVLPYRSPYDQEVLFEHVTQCAKRYGDIRLELAGKHFTVKPRASDAALCALCSQPAQLTYVTGAQVLCPTCARRLLIVPQAPRR